MHTDPYNYLFLSQEGWTMLLLQSVQSEELAESGNFSDLSNVRSKFRDRWDRLALFNCNPWQEIEKLQFILKNSPPSESTEFTVDMEFDPGKFTNTYHISSSFVYVEKSPAFAFIRIFEEVGLPVNCGKMPLFHEALLDASKWIEPNSPPWAMSLMIRTGNEKEIGEFFNRSRIVLMTSDHISSYFDLFINSWKQSFDYLNESNQETGKKESFSNLQVRITSELLSRLAFRLSQKQINELLDIAIQLYSWNIKNQNITFNRPLNHLFERIFYSMNDLEIIEKLNILLDLPIFIHSESQHPGMDDLADPFTFIEWNRNTIIAEELRSTLTTYTPQLIDLVENGEINDRIRAIHRLIKMYEIKGLSSIEEDKFGKVLWSRCDPNTGLPSETYLLNASFLYLPEPESGIAREKVHSFLSSMDVPKIFTKSISADGKPGITTSIGSSFDNYITNWRIATFPIGPSEGIKIEKSIDWTSDDAFNLLLKIEKMWDEDKEPIINYFGSDSGFLKSNADQEIRGILELLLIVILPRFSKMESPEAKQIIKSLIDEMESNNICTNLLIALQILIEPEKSEEISRKLRKGLISLDENEIKNSVYGLFYWIVFAEQKLLEPPSPDFMSEIINQITNRRQPNLKYNLSMVTNILNRYTKFISPAQIDSLCLTLEYLLTETEINSSCNLKQSSPQSTVILFPNKPEFRKISTRLAFALFNYFNREQMEIPDVILKWKEVGQTDSLPEVRREWKSA